MTVGALTVFLAYLAKFFKPVQDLAKMTNTIAQTAVGLERIQAILSADDVIPEKPHAATPPKFKGEIAFEHVAFGEQPGRACFGWRAQRVGHRWGAWPASCRGAVCGACW